MTLTYQMHTFAETVAHTAQASSTPTVSDPAVDLAVTKTVQTKLASDSELTGLNITIVTSGSTVTLGGVAQSQAQINKAIEITRGTAGVTKVKSTMTVAR